MPYDPYSRTNQILLEGAIVGISLFLAFQIRYEGHVPPYHTFQFWAVSLPVIAGRLVMNFLFGLHRIQWRYVSLRDAFHIIAAYLAFSCFLLVLRFGLPAEAGVIRIPASVIAIEFLLSTQGALGARLLRRYVYERQARRTQGQGGHGSRRMVLVGAGLMGSRVAKEMASRPGIQIVGFLDDDPHKIGCVIAGIKVLGPTTLLPELARTKQVDDVLVCIAPTSRNSFTRLWTILENLPIRSRIVPTFEEILEAKESLQVMLGQNAPEKSGNGSVAAIKPAESTAPRPIRNMTILITGGAGFIGSSLAVRLVDDNQIILLDRMFSSEQPVSFTSLLKHPNVRAVEADIMDGHDLGRWAREADLVVHAAAIVGVGKVCHHPRETLETNFVGTSQLLRAFENSPRLRRFVYFSTSEVFGVNSFRVHEGAPSTVGPAAEARWSYAIAKLAGEHLVKAYHRQAGMPVVTVRPFNVFGPRRIGANAILQFVLCCLRGRSIEVHGDGSQIRSWCYIEDFCDALIEMLRRPEAVGEDFNVGNPTNTLTVYQLAQKVLDLTGAPVPIIFTEPPFPDIDIRVPSLDKARTLLGYKPVYDLHRGLQLTIDWYRSHLELFESRTDALAVGA